MKKIVVGIVLVLLLTGCSKVSERFVVNQASIALDDAIVSAISTHTNIDKGFISYYLEPFIGRRDGNASNSVFIIDGEEVVLNVDVPSIITAKYYASDLSGEGGFRTGDSFPNLVLEKEGSFFSGSGLIREFQCRIYQPTEEKYGILIQTSNVMMYAEVPYAKLSNTIYHMMRILRTVRVDEEKVVTAYSQKEMMNYHKETLEIFQTLYPEDGTLHDMLNDNPDSMNQKEE